MKAVVPFGEAHEEAVFGAKAVGLGEATRAGLSVPPGIALSGDIVEEVAAGHSSAIDMVIDAARPLAGPLAVRSSAVDEDGADASFAGQHLTLLNVPSIDDLSSAIRQIWWSANSDSVITYRKRVGLFNRPSVGVVVQSLLAPETAGVMFTQNPVNGADERMIEASWGLGEVVVSGRVIPDTYRLDRSGEVLERTAGVKKIAIRSVADGGTVDEEVATRSHRVALPRRRPARPTQRLGQPVRGGLRDGLRHRMGLCRREPLPAPVPGRDPGRIDDAADRPDPSGLARSARAGAVLRRAEPGRRGTHRRHVQGAPVRRR